MLGDQLGESKGKRLVRRVLSSDPLRVEVSFEDAGTMLGVATKGFGTYTSEARPDGSLYGEGHGAMITADGEPITWRGSGAGKLLAGGAVSYPLQDVALPGAQRRVAAIKVLGEILTNLGRDVAHPGADRMNGRQVVPSAIAAYCTTARIRRSCRA